MARRLGDMLQANDLIKHGSLDRYTADLYLTGALKLVSCAKGAGIGICVPDEVETWIESQMRRLDPEAYEARA